ncbi:hypothetical protein FISHEDRAFT_46695 [Fistulina hepatica ATCC 64428]|uniref:Uncharacterized protein n=1 Tax=Fistulina hepatica ATCC 64428 TaxID=1128425 RepID=A0A0D7A8L6_9AGAR|nr:hypothetical protein FISHEDRAFT_46695 [Fistulina hepatica ATCC 64428]
MRLGVALYWVTSDPSDPCHSEPHFHWALVTTSADSWAANEHTLYKIVQIDGSQHWKRHFTKLPLETDTMLRGIVEFAAWVGLKEPEARDMIDFVDHGIHGYSPAPDVTFRIAGPQGWTCATWTLKVMLGLEEIGIWSLPPEVGHADNLYKTILEKGHILCDLQGSMDPFPVLKLVSTQTWSYNSYS